MLFVDDHTRVCWVFLMKEKYKISKIFKKFHKMVQTQFQAKIKILRTDNGGIYFNSVLGDYL